MEKVAVLDSGGQYCHLIARKVRELGVYAEILPLSVDPDDLHPYKGVIISGGPSSVFAPDSSQPHSNLFQIRRPLLGICYGHQLMAHHLDGEVQPGTTYEFGKADLRVRRDDPLFNGQVRRQRVWMSHGDQVTKLPAGFQVLGDTRQCNVAAMGNLNKKYFGLQFHPEVAHTVHGAEILHNFLSGVCRCGMNWHPEDRVTEIQQDIQRIVKNRRVLFFLSGGVDSTVAYALTVGALNPDRVHGVYVDTGFMRAGETQQIQSSFERAGFQSLEFISARGYFFSALRKVIDPEQKRKLIGKLFVDVQDQVLVRNEFKNHDWVLGQGTIYPDTIESGGSANSSVIKTHHNRVKRIEELIKQGRVLEPLSEFYKDEVRVLGRVLGLPQELIARHPFPGPGLAIRCICSGRVGKPQKDASISEIARSSGYRAVTLPLRSVGVQGDRRSYAKVTLLYHGDPEYRYSLPLATAITNQCKQTNRVAILYTPKRFQPSEWKIHRASLSQKRVRLLQQADSIVMNFLKENDLYNSIWQCPVVLLPFSRKGGETIVLRPITAVDGMTAEVAQIPGAKLHALARKLMMISEIEAVFLDISRKPPSTIEWE